MGRAEDLFARFESEGEAYMDELIGTQQTEFLFLDYKRSADNGGGRTLHQRDRDNLSKAISGFANSEGGVMVWGVECDSATDLPSTKMPLDNPAQFRAKVESMITGATVPPHRGVVSHAFPCAADPGKGFVVTLVPKSNDAPHRRIWGTEGYYARSGSDFKQMGHDTLAGMFGRRPTPQMSLAVEPYYSRQTRRDGDNGVSFSLKLTLTNTGPTIIRDYFVYCQGWAIQNGGHLRVPNEMYSEWVVSDDERRHFSLMSVPTRRLAPMDNDTAEISFRVENYYSENRRILLPLRFGCDGSPVYSLTLRGVPDTFERLFERPCGSPHSTVYQMYLDGSVNLLGALFTAEQAMM